MEKRLCRKKGWRPDKDPQTKTHHGKPEGGSKDIKYVKMVASPRNHQLDYNIRTKEEVKEAEKKEAILLMRYRLWLKRQERNLPTARHEKLQCDGFEKERRNLIEAKSSISREHIRMAVGQLLDYAFHIKKKFGKPNMGILLPEEPDPNSVDWLQPLKISLVWRKKAAFLDNTNGQFT